MKRIALEDAPLSKNNGGEPIMEIIGADSKSRPYIWIGTQQYCFGTISTTKRIKALREFAKTILEVFKEPQ
jgi:hypothetical protein